ncbi:hypothetical protein OROGR_021713 [Orobanche gracilis]
MMNLLALGLVLTSILTAGLFTPSPENQKSSSKEEVIVKEGHRVVVVEFEKDDAHTKVVISPQDSEKGLAAGAGNAKGKLSEKNMEDVKQITPKEEEEENEEITTHQSFRPRELVCDAYGKCKHKIASAFGKTKDTVAEKAHDVADKASEVTEGAKEAVSEAIDKVKDTASHTAHQAFDKMHESKGSVKESAGEVKDTIAEKASEIKEGAKEKAQDVIETTKNAKEEFERNASRKMEETMMKKEGKKKELLEIMHHAREVGSDFFEYVFSPERLTSVSGILHLMGLSAAYGMCVWVTFVSSYVMAEALPRHQFAMAQSKIYPVYFKAMAYSVGMAILGHMMNGKNSAGIFPGIDLLASLAMILVNLLCLEPRATKVMLERMKKEKEEGIGKEGHAGEQIDSTAERAGRGGVPSKNADGEAAKSGMVRLSEKLQRLNSYSSFLNVMTLVSLTWHLVLVGQRLHMAEC